MILFGNYIYTNIIVLIILYFKNILRYFLLGSILFQKVIKDLFTHKYMIKENNGYRIIFNSKLSLINN